MVDICPRDCHDRVPDATMGLDEKMAEFAKNVFRKAKESRRSIDEDFKEVAKMIGYEPTVAQSFMTFRDYR